MRQTFRSPREALSLVVETGKNEQRDVSLLPIPNTVSRYRE